MFTRFEESERLLKRALRTIPNGTQTFSKSRTALPYGVSPFYASHADGPYIWDVDGNCYIDFVSALCPVILGYNDPDVTAAVVEQVRDGVLFSLPHELEIEVSETLVRLIPCAEMVRFGKNGSDATTGAIRAARSYTGRDHIAMCGYHGWHDWSMGNTPRNRGIPQAVRDLTHVFTYNDIGSLRRLFAERPHQYAAVIMEPMNREYPVDGFLHECRELAHQNGALFILDEVITGFRFGMGGAQELFGVTPDLACFGKAMANGYPLAAIVGRGDVMREFERVHYSYTNAGELVSLAAAKATLEKLERGDVASTLAALGAGIPGTGHPAWRHIPLTQDERPLFLQEMHKAGFLCLGTVNLTWAHEQEDVDGFVEVLGGWRGAMLECEPTSSVYRVR